MWKVYGLVDSRTEMVRYVGCTSRSLSHRLGQHLAEAWDETRSNFNSEKAKWLRELIREGGGPRPIELARCETKKEAWEVEKRWITQLRSQLINEKDGGEGYGADEQLRRKISEGVKRSWAKDDARRAALSELGKRVAPIAAAASAKARKGRPLSESHRAAIGAGNRASEKKRQADERRRGVKQSPEFIEKRKEAYKRPEVQEKLRQRHLGRKWDPKVVAKRTATRMETLRRREAAVSDEERAERDRQRAERQRVARKRKNERRNARRKEQRSEARRLREAAQQPPS